MKNGYHSREQMDVSLVWVNLEDIDRGEHKVLWEELQGDYRKTDEVDAREGPHCVFA